MKIYIVFLILLVSIPTASAYLSIPPTPAIKIINGTFGNVTADMSADFVTILNSSGILVDFDYSLNTITIGSSISSGGVNNTISSIGTQQSIVSGQVNNDHQLKGIACGGDLQCSNNATDVTISFTDTGVGSFSLDSLTDVIITSPALFSTLFYDGVNWIDKIFTVNSVTCSAGQFVNVINNQTGETGCSTPSGSGFTNIATAPVNATILADNSTVTNRALFKTISAGAGIQIDNGTDSIIIKATSSGGGFTNIATISTSNATLIAENSTGTKAVFKTIGGGAGILVINGSNAVQINGTLFSDSAQGNVPASGGGTSNYLRADGTSTTVSASGGATSLANNVTSTLLASAHTQVFSIPLTANSGNSISGVLTASSSVAGGAVQAGANTTNANSRGYCLWGTPTAAATLTTDFILANSSSLVVLGDTAETTWLPAVEIPQPITFDCSITSGATAGNLRIFIQAEVASTVSAKAGSYYIKTP